MRTSRGKYMKRSDAVKILRDIFLTHMNCAYNCCGTDEEMYSRILEEIEFEIGMKPIYHELSLNSLGEAVLIPNLSWEVEDEKK